ncbi:MAG: epoxyqueuosine reductase QueH [Negativicutes bacterium]|nr:epoxyqueuosine reductase QueH [Negativicutes bacterium]
MILLHACCAPCSTVVAEHFRSEQREPLLYYFNPNIQSFAEYQLRRDALLQFAAAEQYPLLLDENYQPLDFLRHVLNMEGNRCAYCYALRLEKTAQKACELGLREFSTTMFVSPYQDREKIMRIGSALAEQYHLSFLTPDLRAQYHRSIALAKAWQLYRQGYCGCLLSEYERYFPSQQKE